MPPRGGLLPPVGGLGVQEIEPGLWLWSAAHPEWNPAATATGGWVEEVGSVYCELPAAVLLIDPVVPDDPADAERLWRALDRDVERLRRPVSVLVTVHWHRRGADAVIARYGALDGVVPDGARAIALGDPIGETAYALPQFRALAIGDCVLGGDAIEGDAAHGAARVPTRVVRPHGRGARVVPGHGHEQRPAAPRAGAPRADPHDPRRAAAARRARRAARARGSGPVTAVVATGAVPGQDELLDAEALRLIGDLERRFGPRRRALLGARAEREERFAAGERPSFPEETRELRESEWTVAAAPADLDDRRVELTGPADAKMVINALNSGASVFMCCLEDALSPTWGNVVAGHEAVRDATRRTLTFDSPEGKSYTLGETLATLVVRPRGWHMEERHVHVDGRPVSASLFDLALFLRWNGRESVARGSGPYVYLAKLESRHEAELWNDVFVAAQEAVGLPRGTIRATVLIETITASFEMEEILYALREHSAGLNAGRWDYIFSAIKKFRDDPRFVLPDRAAVTMAVPFMHAYTEQLVRACHRRGAHAIGGMAAFIPSRDAAFNEQAFAKVREDKEREAGQGFDGTWVAHPGLVPLAREIFEAVLGDRPNQKSRLREDVEARRRRAARARPDAGRAHPRGRADERLGRPALPRLVAQRHRRGGDRQPHGGRGHRRDLPCPALAVDAAPLDDERRRGRDARAVRARARRRAGAPGRRRPRPPRRRRAPARRAGAGRGLRGVPDAARRRAAGVAAERGSDDARTRPTCASTAASRACRRRSRRSRRPGCCSSCPSGSRSDRA